MNKTIILTPCYEDYISLGKLLESFLVGDEGGFYFIIVDDGSLHHPVDAKILENFGLEGLIIRLKRNVGHQKAIAIGLNYISENFSSNLNVVVMDSDGEDRSTSVQRLLAKFNNPNVDIVVAKRGIRFESVKFKIFYFLYKLAFRMLTGRKINFGNFCAIRRSSLSRLVSMNELWIHLPGCILLSKLRIYYEPIDRGQRFEGKSKMNFFGLVLHGFRGLMVFAEDVLVRAGILFFSIAALAVIFICVAFLVRFFGEPASGWLSIAFGIIFLVFLQTGSLTLMTLILAGISRGQNAKDSYKDYIQSFITPSLNN
ncbi:glycosyltransferase family 2 protein [Polynucleobacter hallstattensis]|uniref:glycosyltransferase family 2 protein n=1 Tax=Polynucleobacter hallstattensis TaxID=1855586 RepID=UPI001C0E8B58|nr:glycosyltransferase [Polynucleobacter hallstattensis]MBU3560588.1 glycosyltransferase [Polynucleobacter hallstattensis]